MVFGLNLLLSCRFSDHIQIRRDSWIVVNWLGFFAVLNLKEIILQTLTYNVKRSLFDFLNQLLNFQDLVFTEYFFKRVK